MSPDVVAALEAATEGGRELDGLIALSLGWKCPGGAWWCDDGHGGWRHAEIQPWTTSVDAALTLVPDGFDWSFQFSERTRGEAWLYPPNNHSDEQFYSKGGTMALAACAAALYARTALRATRHG